MLGGMLTGLAKRRATLPGPCVAGRHFSLTLLDSFKTRRHAARSLELVPDLAELGNSLDGELFSPDSPGYEAIRRPVNLAYREVRPRLVVLCRSVSDVVGAMTYATATEELVSAWQAWAPDELTVNLTLTSDPGAPKAAVKNTYDPHRFFDFPKPSDQQ